MTKHLKWVYLFEQGDGKWCERLGSKGAGLASMTKAGLPVPPGFTITTEACNEFYAGNQQFPAGMWDQALAALRTVEEKTGKKFGDAQNPLLVSVRSGAKSSMHGMMDTVLNLGLNDDIVKGHAALTSDERFAYSAYCRFIQLFGRIVLGVDGARFEDRLEEAKRRTGVRSDADLAADTLKQLVDDFKAVVKESTGKEFPTDVYQQMQLAIMAVFSSWNGERAIAYRNYRRIPHNLGTAVNVQTMVFGNMGNDSGTGVAVTRNPSTGEKLLYGEFLVNAQGDDVVAGLRTPEPISRLQERMPEVVQQLEDIARTLESLLRDVQDMEFTIERGRLYMLQARNAKLTAIAGLRIAMDLFEERLVTAEEAVMKVTPEGIAQLLRPRLPEHMTAKPVAIGLGVSPGVATGVVVFGKDRAESLASRGVSVILVRPGLQRSDTPTLAASAGLVASREGITGIGAIIARGLGKPCVTGVQDEIDRETWEPTSLAGTIREGMAVTIDGDSGAIYQGEIPLVTPGIHDDPHLSRYADLIGRLDPDSFVDDELGAFWLLRDTLSHGSPPYPPSGRGMVASSEEKADVPGPAAGSFVSFVQPSREIVLQVLHRMHGEFNPDDGLVAWGLLHQLNRLLLGAAGAGNHHLAIRPLLDPMTDLPAVEQDSGRPGVDRFVNQVVGVEFFGINRLLPNLLPWGSIQWWALLLSERDFLWGLDRTNPQGESLIPGTSRLRSFLVVLDGTLLSIADTRRCYNDLRKRDLSWDWYERHNTSYQEMVKSLRGVRDGLPIDPGTTGKLVDAGLLTSSAVLSPAGLSLLGNETAKDRRSITFRWREANEGN